MWYMCVFVREIDRERYNALSLIHKEWLNDSFKNLVSFPPQGRLTYTANYASSNNEVLHFKLKCLVQSIVRPSFSRLSTC